MAEPRKLRVFICHASQDKPVVRKLHDRLVAEDWIDPWLDTHKLLPGQDWRIAIEDAVESADNIIICLSKNSVAKEGYLQKEMRYAQEISLEKPEGTVFLIPLKLEECETPRGLRFVQWVNYFGKEKEANYLNLLRSLQLRLEQIVLRQAEESTRIQAEAEAEKDQLLLAQQPGGGAPARRERSISASSSGIELSHETVNFEWVKVRGRLDSSATGELGEVLDALIRAKRFNIVVDMTETNFISSSGFLALLRTKRACRQYNRGDVVLVVKPGPVYTALDLAGLVDFFKVGENPLEAFQGK